jgi:molybdopterin molybdotransferase
MLQAMLVGLPCDVHDAGILRDDLAALETSLLALSEKADIIVTTGGASVGDHDLVQTALLNIGAQMDVWKVAMRPGKPLMRLSLACPAIHLLLSSQHFCTCCR